MRCFADVYEQMNSTFVLLLASTSWSGSFRTAMGQIAKLRDQLEPHTRMFGTTATLTSPMTWENIETNAVYAMANTCI